MNRRTILKNAGVGVAATAGIAGTASADGIDIEQLPRIDPDSVRAALADDPALLEELAADGVIETPSVDELDLEYSADDDLVVAERTDDGEWERRLSYTASVEGGELVVGLKPSDETPFAIHVGDGDRTPYGPMEMSSCICTEACCCAGVCFCCCQWSCGIR